MIIVRLIGGLGNQLFQYATARRLAKKHDAQLKIDISGFSSYKLHNYSLNHFNIIENFVTDQDLERLKKPLLSRLKTPTKFLKNIVTNTENFIIIKEKFFHFDPDILNLQDNTYLIGYWQSEKYFKDIEEIIRHDFSIIELSDVLNLKIRDDIISHESVSIHVRRGDYITNPTTNLDHGVCNIEYYRQAINIIQQTVDKPHFFVFSDDPEWTQKNINVNGPVEFVTNNDASKNYEDLRLMSLCQHHIIANSSFSWWGAWLDNNPKKIVIAPRRWFNQLNVTTNDLIPDPWITI